MDSPNITPKVRKTTPLKTPTKRHKLQELSGDVLAEHLKNLQAKEKQLDTEVAALDKKTPHHNLNAEMQALHTYNDMKDFTQIVLGYLSDIEHCTLTELHKRYNLPTD